MLQVFCISLLIYNYILSVGQSPQSWQKPNWWLDNNWARLISTDVGLWVCSTQNVQYIVTENLPQCGCEVPWQTAEGIGVTAVRHRRVFSGFYCTHTLDFLSVHGPFCQTLMFDRSKSSCCSSLCCHAMQDYVKSPYGIFISVDNQLVWKLGYQLKSMCCFLVGHRPHQWNISRILQVYICKLIHSSNAVCPAICIPLNRLAVSV